MEYTYDMCYVCSFLFPLPPFSPLLKKNHVTLHPEVTGYENGLGPSYFVDLVKCTEIQRTAFGATGLWSQMMPTDHGLLLACLLTLL